MDVTENKLSISVASLIPNLQISEEERENIENNEATSLVPERVSRFDIVSKVAYLCGVQERHFHDDTTAPMRSWFDTLEKNKSAHIIRNLNILRTQLIRKFSKIYSAVYHESRTLIGMPEYISTDVMQQLSEDKFDIYNYLNNPLEFLYFLNESIKARIGNCKDLFPEWISWKYISDIFIMPNGDTSEGTKAAQGLYHENYNNYPFNQYLNFYAREGGNALYNDNIFLTLLYEWNGDSFTNGGYVSDVNEKTKDDIRNFIKKSGRCVFVVDCENSDPYNLCAAIKGLNVEEIERIEKIILYDDIHAASAWDIIGKVVQLPVEYGLIERLKDNKSLTDIKVTSRVCKEYYESKVDSFVLVSSDSDYWGLIEELPKANFLVMVERDKCSSLLISALVNHNIGYCYLDDFYMGGGDELKKRAIEREITKILNEEIDLNAYILMHEVLAYTRVKMGEDEIKSFVKKQLFPHIGIEMNEEGDLSLTYRSK